MLLLEQSLNGLNYGLLLFLVSAGLSLVFGVMRLINLAHGSLYMVGAFAMALSVQWKLTDNFVVACLIGVATAVLIGIVIERGIIRNFYRRPELEQVLATFGLILFFNEFLRFVAGAAPLYVAPPQSLSASVMLPGGVAYSSYKLVITAISLLLAIAMWLLLTRTRTGMLIRASADNPQMVKHMAFDSRLVSLLVFTFGACLAGIAGVLVAPLVSIEVGMGESVLILAFVVVVIGGLGSISGTFIAALSVGMVDTLGRAFVPLLLSGLFEPRVVGSVSPAVSATLVYMLMAAVLLLRPHGEVRR